MHAPAFFSTPKLQWSAPSFKALALAPDKARVTDPIDRLPTLPATATLSQSAPTDLPSRATMSAGASEAPVGAVGGAAFVREVDMAVGQLPSKDVSGRLPQDEDGAGGGGRWQVRETLGV